MSDDLRAELDDLRRRVEATEAILAIQELKAHYAELLDQRFVRGVTVSDEELERIARDVASLFMPEAVWDGGPALKVAIGREAIAARMRKPTIDFSRHLFVKPRIQVDGDAASARWDILCPCRTPDGTSYWMSGIEDDTYARIDGVWFHQSMKLSTVFMTPITPGWDKLYY